MTLLDDHLARSEAALVEAAGDRALCAIARSGTAVPAAKYHEGARAALADVRRRSTGEPLAGVTTAVRAAWQAQQERGVPAGREWEAYRTGGLDALEALAADLGAADPR